MPRRKEISGSLSVTTVIDGEDGAPGKDGAGNERAYFLKANDTAPTKPTGAVTSTSVNANQWTTIIPSVTQNNPYVFVTERKSVEGTWGAWSNPVVYIRLAADGKSIAIKGEAVAIATGSATSASVDPSPAAGHIVLQNGSASSSDIQTYNGSSWVNGTVAEGDGYMLGGHLYMRTAVAYSAASGAGRWQDVGNIQGPQGDPGDDAVMYWLETDCDVFKRSGSTSTPTFTPATFNVVIHRIEGETDSVVQTLASGFALQVYVHDVWTSVTYANGKYTANSAQLFNQTNGILKFRFLRSSVVVASKSVTSVADGAGGSQGKMGRNLYFAGAWEDFSGTFEATDHQAPYFSYVNTYVDYDGNTVTGMAMWAFIGPNGVYTKSSAGDPPDDAVSDDHWELMQSQFNYIIGKGAFFDNATLGAAVYNGDFHFSQYGYMLGFGDTKTPINSADQYQHIDPTDIFGRGNIDTDYIVSVSNSVPAPDSTYVNVVSFTLTAGRWYTLEVKGTSGMLYRVIGLSTLVIGTVPTTGKAIHNVRCVFAGSYTLSIAMGTLASFRLRLCKFVPNTAFNFLTGDAQMNNLYLRGNVVRGVTEVTPTNYQQFMYIPSVYSGGQTAMFDLTRLGTLVRFSGTWGNETLLTIYCPDFTDQNEGVKDGIRGLAGQMITVINATSNKTITFINQTGKLLQYYTDSSSYDYQMAVGKVAILNCDYGLSETWTSYKDVSANKNYQRCSFGGENVLWRIRISGTSNDGMQAVRVNTWWGKKIDTTQEIVSMEGESGYNWQKDIPFNG